MNKFEHDSLVVYLKALTPKGDEDSEFPEITITVQISMGDAGEHWDAVLESLMTLPGHNMEVDWSEYVQTLGSWFDTRLKFHRSFPAHLVNFHQSTTKLVTIPAALIHKSKIEWATDHHDTRLLMQITARVPGPAVGVLSEYLGHKLRMETVSPQDELPLED